MVVCSLQDQARIMNGNVDYMCISHKGNLAAIVVFLPGNVPL